MPAWNGARSRVASAARGDEIETGPSSVLVPASPRPGKCLRVAATLVPRYPDTAALVNADTSADPPGKARPLITDPGPPTSETGASVTFTPAAVRSLAACVAWRLASTSVGVAPCDGTGAAHGRIRIDPPSWSVAINTLWRPERCSRRVNALVTAGLGTFARKRIT